MWTFDIHSVQGGCGGLQHITKLGEVHGDTEVQLPLPISVLSMSPLRTDGFGQVRVFFYNKAADLFPSLSLGGAGVGKRGRASRYRSC